MRQWPVYILAGGRSSRFGQDKARALLGGRPLIGRLADQIRPVATQITVVAAAADSYPDLGLRTIADLRPGRGPLAGLEAAIVDAQQLPGPRSPWLVVLTCDMTMVVPEWIEHLDAQGRTDTLVKNYVDPAGRRHPFPGLYHVDLLATVCKSLDDQSLSVQRMIESVSHVGVAAPPDWPKVAQINTPDDLRAAGAEASGSQ